MRVFLIVLCDSIAYSVKVRHPSRLQKRNIKNATRYDGCYRSVELNEKLLYLMQ